MATYNRALGTGEVVVETRRDVLLADRTYYVRTDGSDSNTGLANTAGGAKLTIQGALNAIVVVDFNGFTVTVQIADGTYTNRAIIPKMTGQGGYANLVIQGNSGTPANVIVSTSSGNAAFEWLPDSSATVKDLKITTSAGHCIRAVQAFAAFSNIVFHTCASSHLAAEAFGHIFTETAYTITGNAVRHYNASNSGYIEASFTTITLTGTPAFSDVFTLCSGTSNVFVAGNTYSGAATGTRYYVEHSSVITTFGGGAAYLPGSVGGFADGATGGYYT